MSDKNKNQLWISTMIGVMLFFSTVSTNYIGELLSCKNQRFLTHSRKMKHLIGFTTLFLFVVLSLNDLNYHPLKLILFSLVGYIVFIFVTKTSFPSGLIGFSLFFVIYIIELIKKYDRENIKDEKVIKKRLKLYLTLQKILAVSSVIILVFSFVRYYNKQKRDWGGDFDIQIFLFGVNKCKNIDKPLKYFK